MIVTEWSDLQANKPGAVASLTMGVFDGMHPGHQSLIERAISRPAESVVISFRSPPAAYLYPGRFPGKLMSLAQRLERFESAGVDRTVLINFDDVFAAIPGKLFLDTLDRAFSIAAICIGWNFRCGRGNDTSAADIVQRFGQERVEIVQPVLSQGKPVSSTRLRSLVCDGAYRAFSELAGYAYVLDLRAEQMQLEGQYSRITLDDRGRIAGTGQLVGARGDVTGWAVGKGRHRIDVQIGPQYLQWPLVENESIDYIVLDKRLEKEI